MMKRSILVILAAGFLFVSACRHSTPTSRDTNTVVIGLSTGPKTLDPRLGTDVASARIQQLMFNSLVKKNVHSAIVPDLAESYSIEDDTTYRFNLRHNVKFHDGSLFTARDVKATFDAIRSSELGSLKRSAYDKLKSIEIVDDFTIIFKTTEPFAPFLINMVQGILPEKEAKKIQAGEKIRPIGTGPFMLEKQQGDELFTLKAFPDYFEGKPAVDHLVIKVLPDDITRVMELEKGSIDFLQNSFPPDSLDRLRKNPKLKIITAPGTSYYYLGFNFRLDYPAANAEVRRALAMALDRKAIIHHILGDLATPAESVLPKGHWAYDPDLKPIAFDPRTAGKLLEDAGYPLKDGSRFELEFKCSQNKRSRRLAEVIQAQWAQIGVDVTIRSLEWGTYYDDILKGNFQTYLMSWVGITDPDIYYSLFHSASIPPNGRNRGQYVSAQMDRLLTAGRSILDQKQRAEIYRKVQELAAADLPYINLWHTQNVAVMNKDIIGYTMYPAGDFTSFARVKWGSGGR